MRRRRHWGWGYEDEPVGQGAADLAAHLGFGSAELEWPSPLVVPPPRLDGPPQDDHDRALHAHGASYLDVLLALRGDLPCWPDAVMRPGDEAELLRALEWAHAANAAVIPYGGGTSVVGGVALLPGPGHDERCRSISGGWTASWEWIRSPARRASRPAPPVPGSSSSSPSMG